MSGWLLLSLSLFAPVGSTTEPALAVTPSVLAGDPVSIRVTGVAAGHCVLLTAERYSSRNQMRYRSSATYRADDTGTVDVATQAPLAAPWTGVDPRGLFWSMTTEPEAPADQPKWNSIRISADVDGDGAADLTAMVEMKSGRDDLVGTPLGPEFPGAFLLRAPGDERLPVVIALGGSEGGDRAARSIAPNLRVSWVRGARSSVLLAGVGLARATIPGASPRVP